MSINLRHGMTIPLPGPLHTHRDRLEELADAGYTDVWTSETDSADVSPRWRSRRRGSHGFDSGRRSSPPTPAARPCSPKRSPRCRTRRPADSPSASGRPARSSSNAGTACRSSALSTGSRRRTVPQGRPQRREGRYLLRQLSIDGFRLGIRPEQPPTILIAALREGMLRLAGTEADGTIINWLAPNDAPKVAEIIKQFGDAKEIVARIFVCPSENAEVVRRAARHAIAAYLNVPVYAAFHAWLGRSAQLEPMWSHWRAGDRQAALVAIPDEVVDELIVHGSPAGQDPAVPRQRRHHLSPRNPPSRPGPRPPRRDVAARAATIAGERLTPVAICIARPVGAAGDESADGEGGGDNRRRVWAERSQGSPSIGDATENRSIRRFRFTMA